jgi:phytoene synthase
LNHPNGSVEKKSSFYFPLLLLPSRQRAAMEALYRFCWAADEIADGKTPPARKKIQLRLLKAELQKAYRQKSKDPWMARFQEVIRDFHLTPEPLERILQGVARDLKTVRFKTFRELHAYALQVAGGPGLASMEIFGFRDEAHRVYAENLGVFLQLVNIARDFREDLGLHRLYFPLEDFRRFHLVPENIERGNSHWPPFVRFQLDRAWSFLARSRSALTSRQRAELPTAEGIGAVYVKLYQRLYDYPFTILEGKRSLSRADKILSVVGALGRCALGRTLG